MPDIYYSRPCPACGGRVCRRDGAPYAECTACHKRFALGDTPPKKAQKPARKSAGEPFLSRLLRTLSHLGAFLADGAISLYRRIYGGIRKKNERIPLPKPPKAEEKPQYTPEPPMDEGQRALYRARQKQLSSREESQTRTTEPTRSERVEDFVGSHPTFSLVLSGIVLTLLLVLLTVGVVACVRESRINKEDFTFIYGREEILDRREYKFVAFKTKDNEERRISHRINMTALAELCDLTTSGTQSSPKYALRGGSSYVRFASGSAIALVNGQSYAMDCTAEYDDKGNLWVDLYFIDGIIGGLDVTVDLETNTVTALRRETPEGTILDPVYETITLSAGNQTVYTGEGGITQDAATYKTDVSAYTEHLYPSDLTYLILANKEHPLGADYAPEDLSESDVPRTKVVELRVSAARALEAMFLEMAADGVTDVSITSSYRPYAYQASLFERYVSDEMKKGLSYEEAVKVVETYSSRPGYSEHQTGLCVDFWTSAMTDLTNEQFEPSAASAWLRENAWKFGFILRYPSDKTDRTGYTYESWHYRFVGVDAASEIHRNGWCLEEYLQKNG